MPRRKAAEKRDILPDPLYKSERLAKFINVVMRCGKKAVAEKSVYRAIEIVASRLKKEKHDKSDKQSGSKELVTIQDGLELLDRALGNIRPTVEVKSRRVGGATYQVPIEVDTARGIALAMRWLVKAAKARAEKTMILRLAAEML